MAHNETVPALRLLPGLSTRCRCEREHVSRMRRLARIIVRSENRRSDNRHSGAAFQRGNPTSAPVGTILSRGRGDFYGENAGAETGPTWKINYNGVSGARN